MNENKEGEELINLDELETPNKTKNSDKKSKKFQILNNNKISLLIIVKKIYMINNNINILSIYNNLFFWKKKKNCKITYYI